MSAIAAAPYPASVDRRYTDYDAASFPFYAQPSLNAVTAASSLDAAYPLPAASYTWDTHDSAQSPSYPTSSSSSLSATTHAYSTSSPAHPGPAYAPDAYASQRSLLPSRSPSFPFSSPPSTTSRASYASGTRPYSSLASAGAVASSSSPPSLSAARTQNAHSQWDSQTLYTIDDPAPLSSPSPSSITGPLSPLSQPPSSPPPVKEEDKEGEIIFEVTSHTEPSGGAPMTEVPLRATHAPPEMRCRMNLFRLESFAMHDGVHSAATQPGAGGIEVGPLREEPIELEWQVELSVPLVPEDDEPAQPVPGPSKPVPRPSMSNNIPFYQRAASPRGSPYARLNSFRGAASAGSASPQLDLEYASPVSETWDAGSSASAYESVTDPGGSGAGSPSFAAIATPAQSLGWAMRGYATGGAGDVDLEDLAYRRQAQQAQALPSSRTSFNFSDNARADACAPVSRVSQAGGQYVLSGGSRSAYHPTPAYGLESTSYSRGVSSSRYAQVYASANSSAAWYSASSVSSDAIWNADCGPCAGS